MSDDLSLDTIRQARERVAPFIRHTPLLPPPSLHADLPPRLRLKLENLQVTGAFKVRGAFNTLLHLAGQGPVAGVVGSSGGNHGVALAYAAYRLAIPATIYLPAAASDDRVARTAAWGARVIRHGATWDEAHARGLDHAAAAGHAYVHPFDARRPSPARAPSGWSCSTTCPTSTPPSSPSAAAA